MGSRQKAFGKVRFPQSALPLTLLRARHGVELSIHASRSSVLMWGTVVLPGVSCQGLRGSRGIALVRDIQQTRAAEADLRRCPAARPSALQSSRGSVTTRNEPGRRTEMLVPQARHSPASAVVVEKLLVERPCPPPWAPAPSQPPFQPPSEAFHGEL